MYLKNIEIQGFKSFANKIVFDFHNGITGIVGPNGSGKSNVADAVRWVLGEQRAKQLRGANMQDVIFSGTENRKPLGYAYVAITLDNSDHQLPISYEEVKIARRVYRSGESEYLINGTSCRLKDVNELFYDTGIGKEGYSIIGQGQIDKILNGKPEERRELFDEAAGIVKYKRRKLAAQKKLEDEKQDLLRISDIITEIEKQLSPLEKQSEKAKIYLHKRDELKVYDINMFLRESEKAKEQLKAVEDKLLIAAEDYNRTKSMYDESRNEYEAIEEQIKRFEIKIEELRSAINDSNLTKGKLEGQINVLEEQIRALAQNKDGSALKKQQAEEEIAQKKTEIEVIAGECSQIQEVLDEKKAKMEILKEEFSKIQALTNELTLQMENNKNEIIEILNEKATVKSKFGRYDVMLEQITLRKATLTQKMVTVKSEEQNQEEIIADLKKVYDEIAVAISEGKEKEKSTKEQLSVLNKEIADTNNVIQNEQIAYHREKSKWESLKNLTERYEGYGQAIRKVMEQKETTDGIVGVIADIIKVDKKYETAIETALGGNIQNIVTQDEKTAKEMIAFLKQNKFGRATFLPLTSVTGRDDTIRAEILKEDGVLGTANTLVDTDKQFEDVMKNLLGRCLVVSDIDRALKLAKKYNYSLRMVTLDGELLNPGGSLSGGAYKNSSNLLSRRREMEDMENSINKTLAKITGLMEEIKLKKDREQALNAESEQITLQLQELSIRENAASMKVEQAERNREKAVHEFENLGRESSEIEGQLKDIEKSKQEISDELLKLQEKEDRCNSETEELRVRFAKEKKTEEEHAATLSAMELEYSNLQQKAVYEQQNQNRLDQEINKYKQEIEKQNNDIRDFEQEIEQKKADIENISKVILESAADFEENENKLNDSVAYKNTLNEKQKKYIEDREELNNKLGILDKECFRLNSQKEKLTEAEEGRINYMWNEYEITYSDALPLRDEKLNNDGMIKKRIGELKEEIKKLGDINVNAIEDYKNLLERYTFLNGQKEDLVNAEKVLLDIIEELDIGMRKQFKESFAQINSEFDKAFKELFGGGKGTLGIMEDEDILEAGISIIAQPPGKKLQNMMQLSGGEKALTAIALLFAIQNLKPSPFCLLDEIEAALDESNVFRFAKYLHKLTKNTQFIIITHRRGTMETADRLYGVTMQEKGVSALVSVDLIEKDLDK